MAGVVHYVPLSHAQQLQQPGGFRSRSKTLGDVTGEFELQSIAGVSRAWQITLITHKHTHHCIASCFIKKSFTPP